MQYKTGQPAAKNMSNKILLTPNGVAVLVLTFFAFILLWRCFYSFCWSDESFYLSTVHRLYLGQKPFVDEWHPAQLDAVLILPIYRLYILINGSNDGIYLFVRLFYVAITYIVSIFTYRTLKHNYGILPAVSCALFYLLFSRANIMGLSYYNLFVTFFLAGLLFLYHSIYLSGTGGIRFPLLFFTGIAWALAVVCLPYAAIIYLFGTISLFIMYTVKRNKSGLKAVGILWAGTILPAFFYLYFILSRVSVQELLMNMMHIFKDPTHWNLSIAETLETVIRIICRNNIWIGSVIVLTIFLFVLHKLMGRSFNAVLLKLLFLIAVIATALNMWKIAGLPCRGYLLFTLFGFEMILLDHCYGIGETGSKKHRLINLFKSAEFRFFIVSGIIVAILYMFSSNTLEDAMSVGFIFCAMGMVLAISKLEIGVKWELPFIYMRNLNIFLVILLALNTRITGIYRDAPISELNTMIAVGPAKGLFTTRQHNEEYNQLVYAIESIGNQYGEDDTIFITRWAPWLYLCTDIPCGVLTTWRLALDDERLEEYFTTHKQQNLKYVFVINETYGNFSAVRFNNDGGKATPNKNNMQGFLYENLVSGSYKPVQYDAGTLYIRNEME